MIYKLSNFRDETTSIHVYENGQFVKAIPLDEENTDYQEYLEWLSEGNTPEEAE